MAEQIEVYQSQHSAQQIEDAMGAVLSIGANGNWWIGDDDTGVYAGGVKVTGATPGQTIVVNAVDSEGVPTSWRPFTLPDPGDNWELINSFSVTENALTVRINADAAGNSFELKRMFLCMYLPQIKNTSGASVPTGYANFQVNGVNLRWIYPSDGWSNGTFRFNIEAIGDYINIVCHKGSANNQQASSGIGTYLFKKSETNGKIRSFVWSIFEPNADKPSAMAGATFEVWGVRA